jgi:hypothetical protein
VLGYLLLGGHKLEVEPLEKVLALGIHRGRITHAAREPRKDPSILDSDRAIAADQTLLEVPHELALERHPQPDKSGGVVNRPVRQPDARELIQATARSGAEVSSEVYLPSLQHVH